MLTCYVLSEDASDPSDQFKSRHHSIEYRYAGAEVVYQGIRFVGAFGRMEQFAGLLADPLFGCPYFG
jgi:hypothetical protein